MMMSLQNISREIFLLQNISCLDICCRIFLAEYFWAEYFLAEYFSVEYFLAKHFLEEYLDYQSFAIGGMKSFEDCL